MAGYKKVAARVYEQDTSSRMARSARSRIDHNAWLNHVEYVLERQEIGAPDIGWRRDLQGLVGSYWEKREQDWEFEDDAEHERE